MDDREGTALPTESAGTIRDLHAKEQSWTSTSHQIQILTQNEVWIQVGEVK